MDATVPVFAGENVASNDLARMQSGALFEVGTGDYVTESMKQTLHENYLARGWRALERWDMEDPAITGDQGYISAQDAQAKYGLDGAVKFKGAIKESVAQLMSQEKQTQIDREDVLSRGKGLIQKGAGMTASIGASLLDPVNIALAFIPIVGEARYAQLLGALGKGAMTAERAAVAVKALETGTKAEQLLAVRELEASAGFAARLGARGVTGAANAGIGNVGLGYVNSLYEGTPYYAEDAGRDLAFGAVLGAGLHILPGLVGDHFRGLHETTPPLLGKSAIADIARGEDVRSPGKILELDSERATKLAAQDPAFVEKFGTEPKVHTPEGFDARTRVEGLSDLHNLPREPYFERRTSEPLPEHLAALSTGDKKFANSFDQAAFIATSNLPKHAAEASAWLADRAGLTTEEIIARGKEVRRALKKGEAPTSWIAASERLENQRQRDVENALVQGHFVSPERIKEFPELARGYKDALPALEKELQARLDKSGKTYGAEERGKAMEVSAFNAQRLEALNAIRDRLLSEKAGEFSDNLDKESPTKHTDPTEAEKADPAHDVGEKKFQDAEADPEADIAAEQEAVNKMKQDFDFALDEGTRNELKAMDKEIGAVNSLASKLKEVAACVWGNL